MMNKETTNYPNSQTVNIKSCKVRAALTNVINAIPPQPAGHKPAVTVARLITDTASQQGTPFVCNGSRICLAIEGVKHTLSKEVICWLIEATATKLRVKGLPFIEAVSQAYYLQFAHTVRQDYFTNIMAA